MTAGTWTHVPTPLVQFCAHIRALQQTSSVTVQPRIFSQHENSSPKRVIQNKNSSGDKITNVNFYAVRPQATRIRWNNAK